MLPHRYQPKPAVLEASRMFLARYLILLTMHSCRLTLRLLVPRAHPLRIFLESRITCTLIPLVHKSTVTCDGRQITAKRAAAAAAMVGGAAGAPWVQSALGLL